MVDHRLEGEWGTSGRRFCSYRQLFELVEGRSIMLEEYARQMIAKEEQHIGEVHKMLRVLG